MSLWKHTLTLTPEYAIAQKKGDSADVKAIALLVHQRMERDLPASQAMHSISKAFLSLSAQPEASIEEFNDCMDLLYNWADKNRCWVVTFEWRPNK